MWTLRPGVAPTVHRERGYRLFFFSREESRKHVHVAASGGEAKYWLEPEVALAHNFRLSPANREVEAIVRSTRMNSRQLGISTSEVEVTNISRHGIWILCRARELFMSFEDFTWFKDAPVAKILNVEEPSPNHYHWPDLDIDLGLRTIEHPEQYPMLARQRPP